MEGRTNYIKKHPILFALFILLLANIFWKYLRPIEGNLLVDKKSPHYVNGLYYSDGRFYESVDVITQKMYMQVFSDIKSVKKEATIKYGDYDCEDMSECAALMIEAWDLVGLDHPELLAYGTITIREIDSNTMKASYHRPIRTKFWVSIYEKRIARIIDDIKKETKGMSEYEKVKYVYDYIGRREYNPLFNPYTQTDQSAYSVFIKKKGVCAAFARASQLIFQNIGIESYVAIGTTNGPHAWNIVSIDGEYYYYDSTIATGYKSSSPRYYSGIGASPAKYSLKYKELYPDLNGEKHLFFE